ncbi:BTB/POZ domain-containing protein At5g17580-like [Olea europaea var. sylvestris]|uniref:BTB/POZ domain-containing protein At5g17580-like n=1 Tax=Olea europaea var. sylvestris TaxID=158386 RepID=UPI000C1D4010|nr:BTB/POZ domain-containing protein At5g17580-like [Olea europaea var. sylvestris]
MASRHGLERPTWRPKSKLSPEVQCHIRGVQFTLDGELAATKSAKLSKLLKEYTQNDLSRLLDDIPADPESFELVGRFYHGYDIKLSNENVVRVACIAHYLGMTESHCPNNLLNKALNFFEHQILPNWQSCIKALISAENVLEQSVNLGLVDACMETIVTKAQEDPRLLGEPIKNFSSDDDDSDGKEMAIKPNARRRLFDLEWKSEDLMVLSLRFYEPIIREMIQRKVPLEYVAASLYQYAKKWVFEKEENGEKETVESLERLIPHQKGMFPCSFLFEMLKSAVSLDASTECKNGLEIRIGKQLDQANVKDLFIPTQGYTEDEQHDTESIRRILKNFYSNYTGPDASGFIKVAELVDNFLAEVASDIDLKMSTFISLADMSIAVSEGTDRTLDGLYRAVDIYLDKHRHLTESEREKLCRVLDCNKMSVEAREHAAQNERLPLRVVVQVLFIGQLQLRDNITKEVQGSDDRLLKLEEEEEDEEETRAEMEKMGSKVLELERECHIMRREIQRGNSNRQKPSLWKKMKRKLGCMTTMHDHNCHVKKRKVHPR